LIVIIKINVARFVLVRYLLTALLFWAGSASATDSYEVITNPAVTEKTLSKTPLRAIFGMRLQTWPDGTAIKVFVMPDDAPLHAAFSKEKLNVFPYQLRSAWDRLVFSGTGQAPETVTSQEEMLAKVASTPGAIGYLTKSRIDGRVNVLQIK
jgi:ABC-type phosphate transport system substrate-binding protein